MITPTSSSLIPLVDLRAQHEALKSEIDLAVSRVFTKSEFILGAEVEAFESEFASFVGTRHAVACANGTDALEMALWAAGVGPDDEVITVSHTFAATAEAILRCGAQPRFVDVDPDTLLMDLPSMEAAITPKTRAIVPVHLYGNCVDVTQVMSVARRHDLKVIEDAAQAHGAATNGMRAGSIGDLGTFSFYPAKCLGACGDAGAIVTSDSEVARRLRQARDHGRQGKYEHEFPGRNSRMDALQGAILRVKLPYLEGWNRRRREIADLYSDRIHRMAGVRTITPPAGTESSRHLFVIEVDQRDAVRRGLLEAGVATGVHYPVPLHLQPAFSFLGSGNAARMPATERAATRVLSLPIYPEMTDGMVRHVVDSLEAVMETPSQRSALAN